MASVSLFDLGRFHQAVVGVEHDVPQELEQPRQVLIHVLSCGMRTVRRLVGSIKLPMGKVLVPDRAQNGHDVVVRSTFGVAVDDGDRLPGSPMQAGLPFLNACADRLCGSLGEPLAAVANSTGAPIHRVF